jgi:predicted Zn-dependent peptidase
MTGLMLTPRTREDARVISEVIANSDFYAEYNSEFGYYFFEEDEENYDALEEILENMLCDVNADYRIEGIF